VHVLRAIEEEGAKLRAAAIMLYAAGPVVMYILNNKRDRLTEIEARYAMRVSFTVDDTLLPPAVRIDRLRAQVPEAERLLAAAPAAAMPMPSVSDEMEEEEEPDVLLDDAEPMARAAAPAAVETAAQREESEQRKRRRRRRRGGRRDGQPETGAGSGEGDEDGSGEELSAQPFDAPATPAGDAEPAPAPIGDGLADASAAPDTGAVEAKGGEIPPDGDGVELDENGQPKARRRGRRGGRRRRRGEPNEEGGEAEAIEAELTAPAPALAPMPVFVAPAYSGPTPADPFGNTYDIFDMLEQAEQAALSAQQSPAPRPVPEVVAAPEPVSAPAPVEEVVVTPSEAPVIEVEQPEPPAPIVDALATELAAPAAEPTPTPTPTPVSEAVSEPLVKPIMIGADSAPAASPKRGWWRR
jgi:ribonuclease E